LPPATLLALEAGQQPLEAQDALNDAAVFRALDPDEVYRLALLAYGSESVADEWRLRRMQLQMAS